RAHRDLPPQRLLEGAAEMAQRFGAGLANARITIFFGDDALLALGLDARQPQFLAEDRRQLLHRDVDLEQVLARLVAGLALARLRLATEDVARLPVALRDAARLLRAEAEVRDVDLRQRDGDDVLALLAAHLAL